MANTAMYVHAGKLWALKEDSKPIEMDPNTLLRRWTFDLKSKRDSWEEEILYPSAPGALPRIDERYLSLP